MNIIQIYAPTADKPDDEVEELYEQITYLLKQTKSHEINLIIGDFNAKVGSGRVDNVVGPFGLGARNERGDRLVQFCQEENFKITNTTFCLPPRRLYTWVSPQDRVGNIVRNQIDYILINNRFATAVKKVSTYPGADVLLAKIKIKLAKARRGNQQPKLDIEQLKNSETKARLSTAINNQLRTIDSDGDIWHQTKVILNETSKNILGTKKYIAKQRWMTTEILQMMDKRRSFKNKNISEYKRVNREIRTKIRIAKNECLNRECGEIERLQQLHDDFNLHKKIKEVSGVYKKSKTTNLRDEHNNYAIQTEDKIKVWENYIKKLFSDADRSFYNMESEITPSETPITKDEIRVAIKSAKNNKAPGPDEITSEIIKLVDDDNLKLLEKIFNKVYNTGIFPEDWLKSTFITLPKKSNTKSCDDYRLISLMIHTLKIFLKVIHNRIYTKCEDHMGKTQFGFKKATGTREALFSLQVLVQNCRDVQKDVFLCFVDYEKAFDKVNHEKLINILNGIGIDENILRCIKNLYWQQSANVKVNKDLTSSINIQKGVRQGCILSPMLFNLYAEAIFQESIADLDVGVKVNGRFIHNIRYADDTVLIADNLLDLQLLIDKINYYSINFGLSINISKTLLSTRFKFKLV